MLFVALNILPNDPKALFRRCQAQEKLGKLEAAFQDARTVLHTEPKVLIIQSQVMVFCLIAFKLQYSQHLTGTNTFHLFLVNSF